MPICRRGRACGRACIPRTKVCRTNIPDNYNAGEYRRTCRRGRPCGRTCIPQARRCRIGAAQPAQPQRPARPAEPQRPARPAEPQRPARPAPPRPTLAQFNFAVRSSNRHLRNHWQRRVETARQALRQSEWARRRWRLDPTNTCTEALFNLEQDLYTLEERPPGQTECTIARYLCSEPVFGGSQVSYDLATNRCNGIN